MLPHTRRVPATREVRHTRPAEADLRIWDASPQPAVVVSVPAARRHRAGIGWGNDAGGVSAVRILTCPRKAGAWNAYAGGIYLRSASACVQAGFQTGRRTADLSFAIGRGS